LLDTYSGKELQTLTAAGVDLQKLFFTPDGKQLVGLGTGPVVCWETATGKEMRRFHWEALLPTSPFARTHARIPEVAFSTDGKTLAVAARSTFRLWDVAS